MQLIKLLSILVMLYALAGLNQLGLGQTRAPRVAEASVLALANRLEQGAEQFRDKLAAELEAGYYDEAPAEDILNHYARELESATDRLAKKLRAGKSATAEIEAVLRLAASLDHFFLRNPMDLATKADWRVLHQDLEALAESFNISWPWRNRL